MKTYKNSELEKMIQDVKKSDMDDRYWLYSQMIADITAEDDTATDLARRVLKSDIENMIEKIQSLFQRNTPNCDCVEDKSDMRLLIEWLEHIEE